MLHDKRVTAASRLALAANSRFTKSDLFLSTSETNPEVYDTSFSRFPYNGYTFSPRRGDRYVNIDISKEHRLDILSNVYYHTPLLWWVLALANNIRDPFNEVFVGKTLRIPPLSYILSIIG